MVYCVYTTMEKVCLPISNRLQVASLIRNSIVLLNSRYGHGMSFKKLESTGIKVAKILTFVMRCKANKGITYINFICHSEQDTHTHTHTHEKAIT